MKWKSKLSYKDLLFQSFTFELLHQDLLLPLKEDLYPYVLNGEQSQWLFIVIAFIVLEWNCKTSHSTAM